MNLGRYHDCGSTDVVTVDPWILVDFSSSYGSWTWIHEFCGRGSTDLGNVVPLICADFVGMVPLILWLVSSLDLKGVDLRYRSTDLINVDTWISVDLVGVY